MMRLGPSGIASGGKWSDSGYVLKIRISHSVGSGDEKKKELEQLEEGAIIF